MGSSGDPRPRLSLRAEKPRGTLYGVYTLLEERLGVRWFTPELSTCPAPTASSWLRWRDAHPRLEYREVFWTEMSATPILPRGTG
jgi:hypothetical protein